MTKKQMEKLIPHSEHYCYDKKGICPHLQILEIDKKDYPRNLSYVDDFFVGYPEHYICKNGKVKIEYCHYLKSFLGVQDQVKDCDINKKER